VKLSPHQVRVARFAIAELVDWRCRYGVAQNPQIVQLLQFLKVGGSAAGSENVTGSGQSDVGYMDVLIGSAEAASLLGCSDRWVREISADLDGRRYGRLHVFPRRAVEEYARAKGVGVDRDRSVDGGGTPVPSRAA